MITPGPVGIVPGRLEEWTLETVKGLVQRHEFEPSWFDFKVVLHATGQGQEQARVSLRKTACAMANTEGGYIIFGVRDRSTNASAREERIVGIPLGSDLRKEFGDKVTEVQPPVYFDAISRPLSDCASKGIFVVQIPASPLRPHMVRSTGAFYRRDEGGVAVAMNVYEVREQMVHSEERLRRSTLFRLELRQLREQAEAMLQNSRVIDRYPHRFDTGAYKPLLVDIVGLLPPSVKLLDQLLKVPVIAATINRFMALSEEEIQREFSGIAGDPSIWRMEALQSHARELDRYCYDCEAAIAEVLGPLRVDVD